MISRLIKISPLLIVLVFGCKKQSTNQIKLEKYFETTSIKTLQNNSVFEVTVANSNLVKKKQQAMGKRWVNAEALASVGAVLTSSLVDNNNLPGINTIAMKVQVNSQFEKYSFAMENLRQVRKHIETCEEFAKVISDRDFSKVEPYFSNKIFERSSKTALKEFLLTAFLDSRIVRTEFIGVKTERGVSSLYFNFYYENIIQSYIFNFLNEENKIGGIAVP